MSGRLSFFGLLLAAMAFSWFGLVKWPSEQEAALVPGQPELKDGRVVNVAPVAPGAAVFARLGCFACHTRQAPGMGPKEWLSLGLPPAGTAGTVGLSRLGPDLTGLSSRWTKDDLAAFLKTHGAADEALTEWLLLPEAKGKKP